MGAYLCEKCDGMFCSHDGYEYCEKCETAFCENCWCETLHEEQGLVGEICGDCYADLMIKAKELTEKEETK